MKGLSCQQLLTQPEVIWQLRNSSSSTWSSSLSNISIIIMINFVIVTNITTIRTIIITIIIWRVMSQRGLKSSSWFMVQFTIIVTHTLLNLILITREREGGRKIFFSFCLWFVSAKPHQEDDRSCISIIIWRLLIHQTLKIHKSTFINIQISPESDQIYC